MTAELERLGRGRRWAAVGVAAEALIAIAGMTAAIWFLTRADAFSIFSGIATALFLSVVCALSAWARLTRNPNPDDAVSRAVAAARQHAYVSVRLAAATIWALITGIVVSAVMAFARGFLAEPKLAGFVAMGVVQLMLAAWLAFAFRHYQKRSADLAKLDAIAAQLKRMSSDLRSPAPRRRAIG